MAKKSILQDVATQAQNRRSFVRKLALGATAGAAVLGAGGTAQAGGCFGDVEIVQFVLNLEFLEAEFYTMATTGKTIDQFGIDISGGGTPGPTTGGQIVHDFHRGSAAGDLFDIANQLARDERNHVQLLQEILYQLYSTIPAAKPAINLNAMGYGLRSSTEFVQVGRMLEDIGISAYNWGLNYTSYGGPAHFFGVNLMTVEGQHAGNLRAQCGALSVPTQALDCQDNPTPPSGYYFSTNGGGYEPYRTPDVVLYLAYGGKANASAGGFYPNGVNGYFNTSGTTSCD